MVSWFHLSDTTELDFDGPVDREFLPFNEALIDTPIINLFRRAAEHHPDRLAITDSTRSLSYRGASRHVQSLAQRLESCAPAGRPVGILLPHNALFPVAALACLAANRPYVPIDLKYPPARIDAIIREAGVGAVITDAAEASGCHHDLIPADVISVDVLANEETTSDAGMQEAVSREDMPAIILYTSGSTGKPKGICNNQHAILQRVSEYTNSCHVNADDRFILLSSPGTIAGEREMFTALLNGASLHVTDPQLDGIHSVLNAMAERHITIGYAVPSLLRVMLRLPGAQQAFADMRVLRIGGDITLDSDLALFRKIAPPTCHFFASFSSTETPAVFQWFVPHDWMPSGPRVPIGRPRPGIDFAILGDDGQPVPEGELGELVVRSRYLALGQWQEGQLTAGPFRTDPSNPLARILHTGDMVKLREDGLWELIGRKDRQIKIRGLRIDMGEVEAALRSVHEVADAAVTARRSGEEVSGLAAFVAPVAGLEKHEPTGELLEKLKAALHARVPQYMHPACIHIVDRIPQLPGFKPDVSALEALDRQRQEEEQQEKQAARTAARSSQDEMPSIPALNRQYGDGLLDARIAQAVRHAWTTVAGSKSFEAGETWSETGADSLKAIEFWFYIEDKLGFKLPLDALDEDVTPAQLGAAIRNYLSNSGTKRESVDTDAPLVYLLPGIQSDDPSLVRFRAAFGDKVRFRTLDYPGWRQTLNDGREFDAIVDYVYSTICAEPECDTYRIAGYSFGGIVAFEVARRLVQSGRPVGFLGLLDARRWDLAHADSVNQLEGATPGRMRLPVNMCKLAVTKCIKHRIFTPLSLVERSLMQRPTKLSFWFKRQLTKELRYQALRQWTPTSLDVPTVLFLSDDHWPGEPADHGWENVCRRLIKVHIGGTHATVIQPPQRDALCEHFLDTLTRFPTSTTAPDLPEFNLKAG
ncbi:MAG TPA: AMP-binding protein [Noviherbaspirillum sp.]|jgi:amino acid adenylation domain-containing protein|uniref:AMP-binding protein n=1 Tax=Noviherbaspirillum sp. TaxID=1926288 RepID=UPI002DDD5501|nr:AMP-binding protein [Noviherbaspirillum sp.]HEV2611953.1 AMP-binding protein [Noviherbaspirillum sp.]